MEFFTSFQRDSESLVLGPIVASKHDVKANSNLGFIYPAGGEYVYNLGDSYLFLEKSKTEIPDVELSVLGFNFCGANCLEATVSKVPTDISSYYARSVAINGVDVGNLAYVLPGENLLHFNIFPEVYAHSGKIKSLKLLGDAIPNSHLIFAPYLSTYGLQGLFWQKSSIEDVPLLKLLQSIMSAAAIIFFLFSLTKRISPTASAAFGSSLFFSPWVTPMANNLFWSFHLFILPLAAALYYSIRSAKQKRLVSMAIIGLAFYLKFLAGFEYTSTLILVAAGLAGLANASMGLSIDSPSPPDKQLKVTLAAALRVAATGVVAFFCALLTLAPLRGESIPQGIVNIFNEDVLRRTYGDAKNFDPVFGDGLKSSIADVFNTYMTEWKTPVIGLPLLEYLPFALLLFLGLFCAMLNIKKDVHRLGEYVAWILIGIAPFSWLILAKSHSYVHTHINFVIFYVGTLPAIIFFVGNFLAAKIARKNINPL